MPVPDVVCCNLPYNSQVPRPHQHAAQRLLDAISSFQAQRPDDIGSELISIDILPATSCIALHTCAFLRFANPAVHREAVKQLHGALTIDKYRLRFEIAQRPPQPLTSDTTWRLDRIPPPQATPTVRERAPSLHCLYGRVRLSRSSLIRVNRPQMHSVAQSQSFLAARQHADPGRPRRSTKRRTPRKNQRVIEAPHRLHRHRQNLLLICSRNTRNPRPPSPRQQLAQQQQWSSNSQR